MKDFRVDLVNINWPKDFLEQSIHVNIIKKLARQSAPLTEGSKWHPPHVELNAHMVEVLTHAKLNKRLVRGLEQVAADLKKEQRGLDALKKKQEHLARISRLLLVTSDGSPRLYRNVEKVAQEFQSRLFVCALKIDSQALGEKLFGAEKAVKVIMVTHKEAVSNALLCM